MSRRLILENLKMFATINDPQITFIYAKLHLIIIKIKMIILKHSENQVYIERVETKKARLGGLLIAQHSQIFGRSRIEPLGDCN